MNGKINILIFIKMNDYVWSTHVPLIKLILSLFDPRFILELGIGYYSTPLFMEYNSEKMFIENSQDWINEIALRNMNVILHQIDVPNQDIPVHDISEQQKNEISNYYFDLKSKLKDKPNPRLLFVDNYSCCRALAINILYPVFDLIIYHDCEPQSIARNNYFFEDDLTKNYAHYKLVTPRTWAGCFISNKFEYSEELLQIRIEPIIMAYCKENNIDGIYLQKQTL